RKSDNLLQRAGEKRSSNVERRHQKVIMSTQAKADRIAVPIIIALSILVPAVILILMNLPNRYDILGLEVGSFPFFHAVINFTTAVLLVIGYSLMRAGKITAHRNVMITAFCLSCLFLVSYVISKM